MPLTNLTFMTPTVLSTVFSLLVAQKATQMKDLVIQHIVRLPNNTLGNPPPPPQEKGLNCYKVFIKMEYLLGKGGL